MSEMTKLTAKDGFELSAYVARPEGRTRGVLVVIQEIFGVNGHIRGVADGFAKDGFLAVAPAIFDRVETDAQLGYDGPDIKRGLQLMQGASETALDDIAAAQAKFADVGKTGVVGYCWGGTLAWLSACRTPGFSAAVSYYGGGIGQFASEHPQCPVLMHFGETDEHIPASEVDAVRTAHATGVEIHVYPAGHGFNCDARPSYEAESAKLARISSVIFLSNQLA